MSKGNTSYVGPSPESLYVVSWSEGKYRVYVREGQAINFFSEKVAEGHKANIEKYLKDDERD